MLLSRFIVSLISTAVLLASISVGAAPAATEDEKASLLFDQIFTQWLDRAPVWQSELGIKSQNHLWDNLSEEYAEESNKQKQRQLQQLLAINTAKLSPGVSLSHKLLKQQLESDLNFYQWRDYDYPVNQMFGWHTTVPSTLINIHSIATMKDAEDYIARIKGTTKLMDQLITGLERRAKLGILAPKFVYPMVIDDCLNLIKGAPFDSGEPSPLLADFSTKLAETKIDNKKQKALLKKAERALTRHLKPAYEKLIATVRVLEKRSDDTAGVWKFPNGSAFYNAALERTTTTTMDADEIHALGLLEVARIHQEMQHIMKSTGFKGNLKAFFEYLKKDPRFYFSNDAQGREAYLKATDTAITQMKSRLSDLFVTLPKAELKVKAVEPFREKSAGTAFYQPPPADGSRPGIYYANLHNMRDMPKYQLEALVHHEALPGHHLQLSIAAELGDMPRFRKFGNYTAYIEGWGLYAELLPKEIGLYQDPYSDFGRLDLELWRACRLVVDTGIHAKKWTREQAIKYLLDNTPTTENSARRAIERYIVMPSQATAYKVGMLKILEIRQALKVKQKDRFNIRQFHEKLLRLGPVPLNILEQQMLSSNLIGFSKP